MAWDPWNDGLGKQLSGWSLRTSCILQSTRSYTLAAAAGGSFRLLPSQSLILLLGEDNPSHANVRASPSALATSVSSASWFPVWGSDRAATKGAAAGWSQLTAAHLHFECSCVPWPKQSGWQQNICKEGQMFLPSAAGYVWLIWAYYWLGQHHSPGFVLLHAAPVVSLL